MQEGHRDGGPFYASAELLSQAIEQYFQSKGVRALTDLTGRAVMDAKGQTVTVDDPPTVAGLAYALGFSSRQSLYDYSKRGDDLAAVVNRAKLRIEGHHERLLSVKDRCTGSIFWLKNHGWTDSQELRHSGMVGTAAVPMTPEEEALFKRNVGLFFPDPADPGDAEPKGIGDR
jgi:hypothetical protein